MDSIGDSISIFHPTFAEFKDVYIKFNLFPLIIMFQSMFEGERNQYPKSKKSPVIITFPDTFKFVVEPYFDSILFHDIRISHWIKAWPHSQ